MKTNVEQVADMLQLMYNHARVIIESSGEVAFNIWKPMKIFLKDDVLLVSDDTECTLFTRRAVVEQAMILDHLIEQIKGFEIIEIVMCIEEIDSWGNKNVYKGDELISLLQTPDDWTDDMKFITPGYRTYYIDDLINRIVRVKDKFIKVTE